MKLDSIKFRLYLGTEIPAGHYDRLTVSTVPLYDRTAFLSKVRDYFPCGFTLFEAKGHWRGDDGETVTEDTLVVEIIATEKEAPDVIALARWYADANGQDAVLVTQEPVKSMMVVRSAGVAR